MCSILIRGPNETTQKALKILGGSGSIHPHPNILKPRLKMVHSSMQVYILVIIFSSF